MQQKLAKKDGSQIDRNRDAQYLWDFYQRYKRKHRVDEIQREEQKLLESGTFSADMDGYTFIHCFCGLIFLSFNCFCVQHVSLW